MLKLSHAEKLIYYKKILRSAQSFPSKNRAGIVREIKAEFRAKKSLTNEQEINKAWDVAMRGLQQLSMYNNLDPKKSRWSISLESNPMPRREPKEDSKE
jgi:hypothetical protein